MPADHTSDVPDERLTAGVAVLLGSRVAAAVADADVTMLRSWMLGERPLPASARARLGLTLRCVEAVVGKGDAQAAQMWLRSVDADLGVTPLRLLQDGDPQADGEALLASAQRFARR
jgi:hypothetical protein